jgi:acetyl esterase
MQRHPRPRPHRRAIARSIDRLFTTAFQVARLHPSSRPKAHGVERIRDVRYGQRPEQRLDVWRLRERGGVPAPAVLYMHGGAFQALSKDTHWLHALAWANRGYVVFNVEYRLAPKHPFPAGLTDVCEAAAWLGQHGQEWGADLSRLVLGGDSAGANLAATLAVAACWKRPEPFARRVWDSGLRPRVVSGAYGVYEVGNSGRYADRREIPWAIRERIQDVEDCYLPHPTPDAELADPLVILEGDAQPERPLPAFHLCAGEQDPVMDDTQRLQAALERRGVPCEGLYYPGGHGFDTLIWKQEAQECWRKRHAFVARQIDFPEALERPGYAPRRGSRHR